MALDPAATTGWQPNTTKGRPALHPIKLLKLHGSMNWDRTRGSSAGDLVLRGAPYSQSKRAPNEVVPPVWDKSVSDDPVLTALWKEARVALPRGPVLVAIGYSVPQTDLLSRALIRVAAAERSEGQKLSHVIVANPDVDARRRFIRMVQGGMDSRTSVRVSGFLCERHTMMLPRSMYATQEEDAGGHAGH